MAALMLRLCRFTGILLFSQVLAGCGTIITLGSPDAVDGSLRRVYSGTRFDISALAYLANSQDGGILIPLVIVDLPFCLAADTVLLPYTLTASLFD